MDHRLLKKSYLLQYRGTGQGGKGEARRAQRPPFAKTQGVEKGSLRYHRQTRHEAPPRKTVRICRVGEAQGEHRLPCRSGSPLLQRPLPSPRRDGGGEDHGGDGGDPLQGATGRLPCTELSPRKVHHPVRPHAGIT